MIEDLKRTSIFLSCLSVGSMVLGAAMNRIVEAANGGRMPVYGLDSDTCDAMNFLDPNHICANVHTHLGFLADWIRQSHFIMSPGDVLIDLSQPTGLIAGILLLILTGMILAKKIRGKK